MQKKKIIIITFAILFLVSAVLLWWATGQMAQAYSSKILILEIVSLSLAYIFLQLISLFVHRVFFVECIAVCAFSVSIIFALHFWHVVIVVIALLFLLRGLSMIRKDMRLNVKISLWKSLHIGKTALIFAFAAVLSSQYFFAAANRSGDVFVPGLEAGKVGSNIAMEAISYISPQYQALRDETLTVDEFLLQSYEQQPDDAYSDEEIDEIILSQPDMQTLPERQQNMMKDELKKRMLSLNQSTVDLQKQMALAGGRKELSKLAGRKVFGDEKISAVFSAAIETKVNDFFAPNPEMPERAKAYQFIAASVFFLSVYATGSLFWWLWTLLAVGIFRLSVHWGVIKIGRESVEMEIIE